MALGLFVATTILCAGIWFEPYLNLVLDPIVNSLGKPMTLTIAQMLMLCSIVAFMLGLSQLAFAVVGGLLFWMLRPLIGCGRSCSPVPPRRHPGCGQRLRIPDRYQLTRHGRSSEID